MTNPTTISSNSSKRNSLSINVANAGPRPLQLVSVPCPSPRHEFTSPYSAGIDSPRLPTPPPTTNNAAVAERMKRNSRRQSSISYNPSSGGINGISSPGPRKTNSVGPLSPTSISSPLSQPSRDSTPSPALRARSDREPLLMELHSSLLVQIAQREERSLELKALLKANEEELDTLKRKWSQVVLTSSSAPPTPVTSITPSAPSIAGNNQNYPMSIPNIADPFYGLSSPSLDGLREGAKKIISSLTSVSVPPHTAPGSENARYRSPELLKRRATRENRDSSSSTGSSAMSSVAESNSTTATSIDDEGERCSGEEDSAVSTSLSRSSSLNGTTNARRRSTQGASPDRSLPTSHSMPPSSFPPLQTETSVKDKRNSFTTPLPGLGLAGVVGGLFSSTSNTSTSPLTLTPKRNSTSVLSSSSSLGSANKRNSLSILGGFTWSEMLTPSSTPTPSPAPKQGTASGIQRKERGHGDDWNW